MTRPLGALLVAGALCAETMPAQGRLEIRGRVVDTAATPVADAEILVSALSVRSDSRGAFRVAGIGVGRHQLVVRKAGFSPESVLVALAVTGTEPLRVVLRPVATLDEVNVSEAGPVSARHMGFEDRRSSRNGGQFITRAEIEQRGSPATADLLRRLRGIRMVDSQGVTLAVSSRAPKVNLMSRQTVVNCVLRVGVDGTVKEPGFPVNIISTKEIYGIEVYSGSAQLPTEFNSSRRDAYCGLIMIWTRTR